MVARDRLVTVPVSVSSLVNSGPAENQTWKNRRAWSEDPERQSLQRWERSIGEHGRAEKKKRTAEEGKHEAKAGYDAMQYKIT